MSAACRSGSKQIKLALIFSSKSVNPGSHLTNSICEVKERVGEVWAADMSGGPHRYTPSGRLWTAPDGTGR